MTVVTNNAQRRGGQRGAACVVATTVPWRERHSRHCVSQPTLVYIRFSVCLDTANVSNCILSFISALFLPFESLVMTAWRRDAVHQGPTIQDDLRICVLCCAADIEFAAPYFHAFDRTTVTK